MLLLLFVPWTCLQEYLWVGLCHHMLPYFIMQSFQGMWFRTCSNIACSTLSVSEDDRESERATSGISCEWDPGVKRRGRPSFSARPRFSPAHIFNRSHRQRDWNRLVATVRHINPDLIKEAFDSDS